MIFIQLESAVFDSKGQKMAEELGIPEIEREYTYIPTLINVSEISHIRPSHKEQTSEPVEDGCFIFMKSGEDVWINLTYTQLVESLVSQSHIKVIPFPYTPL